MSKAILDFAKRSPLFKTKHVENNYQSWSERKLQKELDAYRKFCLSNISIEKDNEPRNLSILVESFRKFHPNDALLKQCALYIEDITLNDPLFEASYPKDEAHQAMNKLVGMKELQIDRASIASAVRYIKHLKSAIKAGFVKFLPLSYIHEPPKEIPFFFPKNLFSDLLPEDLIGFFRDNAQVSPLYKIDKGWAVGYPKDLKPCRGISIHFGDDFNSSMIYFLNQQEIVSFDEETGIAKVIYHLPTDPPSSPLFENWVFQSVNKTAYNIFTRIYNEVRIAHNLNATYLTNSKFVADLLRKDMPVSEESLKTGVMNMALDLDLPILQGVSLDRIIKIREKDGEVFQNFRLELEQKLKTLRQIDDANKLKSEIENVFHELSEVQINEVNKKISKIKKRMVSDVFILVGGLASIIQAEGFGIPLLTYGVSNGLKTFSEYKTDVREHPAFFLWKLREGKGK